MNVRDYVLVTGGYWAFTITDGALRMLVLLYFHDLGYSPVALAMLFLLYEFVGVFTNLIGGWVGARVGLNRTLLGGLALQVVALVALTLQQASWAEWTSVAYVMGAQALSGLAKDLTKMSSKSAVKFVARGRDGALFALVAALTGSKNALKGVGFFLGAGLLAWVGYDAALWALAALVAAALVVVAIMLTDDIGRSKNKPPLRSILSKSTAINRLSAARFFLFAARDIWFVVALPVFLETKLGWNYQAIGAFLAIWVIGYGVIQSVAPQVLGWSSRGPIDEIGAARRWSFVLAALTAVLAVGVSVDVGATATVVVGLALFGGVFALNSSLHSYLILAYSDRDDVALDVGFYYSANAAGRLVGTLLSGLLYLWGGFSLCLVGSALFLATTWLVTMRLPALTAHRTRVRL